MLKQNEKQFFQRVFASLFIFICYSLSIFAVSSAGAEQVSPAIRFWPMPEKHPLKDFVPTDISVGPNGFLWLASNGGLVRYDGNELINYRYQPRANIGLLSNIVNSIVWDKHGILWIGTAKGLNRFDPATEQFTEITIKGMTDKTVNRLFVAQNGLIWLSVRDGGLYTLDPDVAQVSRFTFPLETNEQRLTHNIKDIAEDKHGGIWLATTDYGVVRINYPDTTAEQFDISTGALKSNRVVSLFNDKQDRVWLGTIDSGVYLYEQDRGTFKHFPLSSANGRHAAVYDFAQDNDDSIWIATWSGGVFEIRSSLTSIRHFKHNIDDRFSLPSDIVPTLYVDHLGILWLANGDGGLVYHDPVQKRFNVFQHNKYKDGLSSNRVKGFYQQDDDYIWLATYGGGLNRYHRPSGTFKSYQYDLSDTNSLSNNKVWSLQKDRRTGDLWVGTSSGLNRFDLHRQKFIRYSSDVDDENALQGKAVFALYQDSHNILWVGTWYGGLSMYRSHTDDFITFKHDKSRSDSLPSNNIKTIFEDSKGRLWVGTSNGLALKRTNGDGFKTYRHSRDNPRSLPDSSVNALFEDNKGQLWIATAGGVAVYNRQSDDFFPGLADHQELQFNVFGILQDAKERLWFSTSEGLYVESNRNSERRLKRYGLYDGLHGNSADYGAFYRDNSGRFYLGGSEGFTEFDPQHIELKPLNAEIVLTEVSVLNQPLKVGEQIEKNVNYLDTLELSYQDYMFGFEFSLPGVHYNQSITYAYRLKGFDSQWITANNQQALYTNVPAGDYVFEARAHNGDGQWTQPDTLLNISISPPWWQTLSAQVAFFLLVAGLLYGGMTYRLNQLNRRQAEQNEAKLNARVLAKKNELFANVSHEFRTPLTMVTGGLEQLQEQSKSTKAKQTAQMAIVNAKRLLRMVDQLLDLARMDNAVEDKAETIDFSKTAQFIFDSLYSLFESKNIQADCEITPELWLNMPRDIAEKIVVNLLSNAVKYTPEGGNIKLSCLAESKLLVVKVEDNGIGIAPQYQQSIFERFVRADDEQVQNVPGAGIGLALVKELVERYEGTIALHSVVGEGSEFTLTFPMQMKVNGEIDQPNSLFVVEQELNLFNQSLPEPVQNHYAESNSVNQVQILIVEDHQEMQRFIVSQLQNTYQCHVADNGEQGTAIAIELIPDLIITDLMMPKRNGYEMVRILRSDIKTSHIPIIMLTAKGDDQSRLEAWKTDIDEYMAKPFNQQELLLRVRSLLNIRKLMGSRLSISSMNAGDSHSEDESQSIVSVEMTQTRLEGLSERDRVFMEKLQQFVAQNYHDSNCKGKQLYDELAMTERQFHRKIKALLSQKFSDYLRSYRLAKGAQMLAQNLGITEVALACGFSSQNYFSLCFKAQYGVSPSAYKQTDSSELCSDKNIS